MEQAQYPQWGVTKSEYPFNEVQSLMSQNPFSNDQTGQNNNIIGREYGSLFSQRVVTKPRKNNTRDKLVKFEAMLNGVHEEMIQILKHQEQAAKRENKLLAHAEEAVQKLNLLVQNSNYLIELTRGYQQTNFAYSGHYRQ